MMDGYVPPAAAGRLGDPSGERVGPPSEMDPSPFPKKKNGSQSQVPVSLPVRDICSRHSETNGAVLQPFTATFRLCTALLPSANPASVREMIVYFVYLRQRHRTSNKTVLQKSKWNRELSQQ
jgi:hypothetical protein